MIEQAEVERLVATAAQLVDDGRVDEWVELFTPDGCFVDRDREIRGREQLLAQVGPLVGRAVTKHLLSTSIVDVVDERTARARTDVVTFAVAGESVEVVTLGRYDDEIHRDDDGRLRFRRRHLLRSGQR